MDGTLLRWLIRLGVLLGAVFLSVVIHVIKRKYSKHLSTKTHGLENQRSLNYAAWGLNLLLYSAVAFYWHLDFAFSITVGTFLSNILNSTALLGLTCFLYGLLPILFWWGRKSSLSLSINEAKRATLRRIGETCLRLLVLLFGLSATLSVWGIHISGILTGLGISSLAIALAAQNLLSNLIGGATLMLDKPFVIGDSVSIGDLSGSVEEVGWRSTRIRSFNDEVVTMPNAKLMDSYIVNLSRMNRRRVNLTLELGGVDAEKKVADFSEYLRQYIQSRPLLQENTQAQVYIQNLRWGGYQLLVRYYIKDTDYTLYLKEVDALFLESTKVMKEMGLTQVYAERNLRDTNI